MNQIVSSKSKSKSKSQPKGHGKPRNVIARAAFEALEQRRMLSTVLWTGADGNALYSDPANWQGGSIPASGDDVVFPDNGQGFDTIQVDQITTLHSVTLNGNYQLSGGLPMYLSGSFSQDTNHSSIVDVPLVLDQTVTFDIPTSVVIGANISESTPNAGIDFVGSGMLELRYGSESYTGTTTVSGHTFYVETSTTSAIALGSGSELLAGGGEVSSLTASGGTVFPFTGAGGDGLTVDSDFTLSSSSTFQDELSLASSGTGVEQTGITVNSGQITLNNATLSVFGSGSYIPANGDALTLIQNNTGNAVSGTFAGLGEGAIVNLNGRDFVISYQGGNSGQDVTLSALPSSVATWTGASGDYQWNTAGNWQGNTVPFAGQAVDFPNLSPNGSGISLASPVSVGAITLDGVYQFNGDTITANGDITCNSSDSLISNLVVLDSNINVTASTDASLLFSNTVSDGGNSFGVTKLGAGTVYFDGSNETFTGSTDVAQGDLGVVGTFASAVTVDSGATLSADGTLPSIVGNGGTISLGLVPFAPANVTVGGVDSFNGSTLQENISQDSMNNEQDGELTASGTSIDLTGATLVIVTSNNIVPAAGDSFTLISNQTGAPVVGTFAGLAEGAVTVQNGVSYKISYVGGSSGQDVTLTVIPTPAVWTDGSGDGVWSNSANWQAGVVPSSGQDVQIVSTTSAYEPINVDVPVTVGSMELGDVFLSGDTITLDGNIDATESYVADPITLGQSTTITGSLVLGGSIGDGGNGFGINATNAFFAMISFTIDSGGNLQPDAGDVVSTYTGTTNLDGTTLFADALLSSSIHVSNGSQVGIGGAVDSLSDIESTSNSTIGIGNFLGIPEKVVVSNGLTFSPGMQLGFLIQGTAVADGMSLGTSSEIDVTQGAIDLNDSTFTAQLGSSYTPTDGDVITLIKNETGGSIVGTFDGLAEGNTVALNGNNFTLSYHGGSSGNDVTLTAVVPVVAPPVVTPPVVNPPVVTPPVLPPVGMLGTTPTIASVMPAEITPSVRPTLSIMGADTATAGESGLTYTWSVAHAPSGAKAAVFSQNGNNSAKSATVRVHKAGSYVLNCVITNAAGNSVTATTTITIKQVASGLRLTPHAQKIAAGTSLQFSGMSLDQFKHPMRSQSAATYAVLIGDGIFTAEGLFTAGTSKGHAIIQLTIDDLTGTVGATIV